MNNHIDPIPDFDKQIGELENFLQRLTDNRFPAKKWSLLWKNLREVSVGLCRLEKKWKAYRKSWRIIPLKGEIKRDLSTLVHGLDVDMLEAESAIEWGIRSSQGMIDEIPSLLPYLIKTDFYAYIEEIGDLLEAVINETEHSELMELLREYREHPEFLAIGQFSTNEMVEHYKHLRDSNPPSTRAEIFKYAGIYHDLCGIYAQDMILCYCLLKLKETRTRPTYDEAQPESKNPIGRIEYVARRIPSFGSVYGHNLRNARAHTKIETDNSKRIVTIYVGREKRPQSYRYEDIVSITQGMSALVIAFRLLGIILSNRDWRGTGDLLR